MRCGLSLYVLLLALLAGGCTAPQPSPSPFRTMASPQDMAGIYRNEGVPPGDGYLSLWRLLHPVIDKKNAAVAVDRPGDLVRISIDHNCAVKVQLLRAGKMLAEQTSNFAYSSPDGCLRRETFGADAKPAFPLVWLTGNESVQMGFDAASAPPRDTLRRRHAMGLNSAGLRRWRRWCPTVSL